MPSCKSVYEPQEDSTLLERYVRQYSRGEVLDVGTGSGIQAIAASQNPNVASVLAVDVQRGAIDYCRENIKNPKIKFLQSDLFSNVKGKFDTVISNPPYLPQELKLKDLTIEGGKKGYEVIEGFLNDVNSFLKPDGIILMVFSSLTRKNKVDEFIRNNMLDFEEIGKVHIFFEDIFVYLLRKNNFLKKLEGNGINNVKYLARGHRGLLFTGLYKNRKIVVKTKNPQSRAIGRIENEAKWLEKLNKRKIGPKLIKAENDYFVYNYIDGDFIADYIKKSNKTQIKKIFKKIFNQMFALDKLKIDKEEMHHPLKHVIISKQKPYLIDFERTHYAKSPKNVTQFCQFLMSGHLAKILKDKKIFVDKSRVIGLAKVYKNNQNIANLNKIINAI
ncbi:methyltransferase [Candidatus Woesearchaeota archaeon]|nr:methyltransferase [Candidatus Woesearchaeota archaeon]